MPVGTEPAYRVVQITCPTCRAVVARQVPVRVDGQDARRVTGECEHCWPWEPEIEQVVERRTAWALVSSNDRGSTAA